MWKLSARWVPHLLKINQKRELINISKHGLEPVSYTHLLTLCTLVVLTDLLYKLWDCLLKSVLFLFLIYKDTNIMYMQHDIERLLVIAQDSNF